MVVNFENEYKEVINEAEGHSKQLTAVHSKHLQCKKRCDLCCMDYRIFPVEFYFILNQLKKDKTFLKPRKKQDKNGCILLKNHVCTIY